ncbi:MULTISPECIES: SlyX family protein [Stutzerimonas]|uniref:Protein SlyX homolog n=2 Tax=Stutzerimonas xanthomarina TaxID=271420 RepID=A0A1M5PAD4_9GAMM|nr:MULTISPECIES: SlyX family protein [Stutzerimonas]MCP9337970.1 SlyX family protein [Stutzerimonas xanthomarina]SEH76775.1 SlyX protein [Stutzerimonas xanthomarina]SHG98409.1 SlyX protein [Stutzerimonas xanthomarina DSM 18231]
MELEQRITDLEARLAFQDDTIQTLSDVLVAQQRTVDRLQAQLGLLARRQEDLQSRMEGEGDEAPPPHY